MRGTVCGACVQVIFPFLLSSFSPRLYLFSERRHSNVPCNTRDPLVSLSCCRLSSGFTVFLVVHVFLVLLVFLNVPTECPVHYELGSISRSGNARVRSHGLFFPFYFLLSGQHTAIQ